MKKSVLILKSDRDSFERFYIEHMQSDNVVTYPIYRCKSGLLWCAAIVLIKKLGLLGVYFYNEWKKKLSEYDTVIVFDRNLSWNIFEFIKGRVPDIRCIAWYWNPIRDERHVFPNKYQEYCEVWSFDKNDCKRYGYIYNTQFYFENIKTITKPKNEYDAFFLGVDKGRYTIIEDISKKLCSLGKRVFIGVVADKDSEVEGCYINQMNYEQVIDLILKSNCIIDVPQNNQEGMTARVLEALFWDKKLITTNAIVKEYEFYNESNIFVWDNPKKGDILEFFEKPVINVDYETKKKYSFQSWLVNFDSNEQK